MLIYVASPYSHEDEEVMEQRYHAVEDYVHFHFNKTPRLIRVSPIMLWHNAAKRLQMPTNAEPYKRFNHSLFIRCDLVEMLKLPGWEKSIGCNMELKWAKDYDVQVDYVDPIIT